MSAMDKFNRADFVKPSSYSHICCKHFESITSFKMTQMGFATRPKLKEGSVPTIQTSNITAKDMCK